MSLRHTTTCSGGKLGPLPLWSHKPIAIGPVSNHAIFAGSTGGEFHWTTESKFPTGTERVILLATSHATTYTPLYPRPRSILASPHARSHFAGRATSATSGVTIPPRSSAIASPTKGHWYGTVAVPTCTGSCSFPSKKKASYPVEIYKEKSENTDK